MIQEEYRGARQWSRNSQAIAIVVWISFLAAAIGTMLFFALFVFSVWATWTSRIGGYPVSRLLELDPLVALTTALSSGYVYKFLGWSLLIVALTFLFGRVFCNWMCPYGTLHQFIGWLFDNRAGAQRIEQNRYHPVQFLKYSILIVTHNMAQARRASEECIFMLMGKVVEHTETGKMFVTPEHKETADYIEGRYG